MLSACGRIRFDPRNDAAPPPSFAAYAAVQAGSLSALQFDGPTSTLAEIQRMPLATPIDSLAIDPSDTYLLEAGGVLTSYSFDAQGALAQVSVDGGGQYSTTLRMRLGFHPTQPWFYLTGDSTGTSNVLMYKLQANGAIVVNGIVGTEATPIGIAVDVGGAFAYTTSGLGATKVCLHPVNADGTLGLMQCPVATCAQPLELFALADRVVLVCQGGQIDVHPLDANRVPTAAMTYMEPSGFLGAAIAPSGIVYAATGGGELVLFDPVAVAPVSRAPLRAGTTGIAITTDERVVIGGDPLGIAVYDRNAGYAAIAATPGDIGGTAISVVAR
jgi:hypothetical protein